MTRGPEFWRRTLGTVAVAAGLLAAGAAAGPVDGRALRTAAEPALRTDPAVLAAALVCHGAVDGASRAPVLLVHGTNVTREENWDWSYGRALSTLRIPWCAVQIPQRATRDLQENVEYLVAATRTVARRSGRRIAIVGASQGGMLPRWMLRYWPSTRRLVEELVGVVPSNHGTTAKGVCDGACVPALRQQLAGSAFLRALNAGAETYAGIDYTTIASRRDHTVEPISSGALTTGNGRIANVVTQDICAADPFEHVLTPTVDPVAFALVRDALDHDGPADATRVGRQGCVQPPIPGADYLTGAAAALSAAQGRGATAPTTIEPPLRCYARPSSARRRCRAGAR